MEGRAEKFKVPCAKETSKHGDGEADRPECFSVSFGVIFTKYWDRGNTEHARMQSALTSH